MSKKIIVVLADGFEELEALAPIDILRRAKCEVVVAGLDKRQIESARGVKVMTDVLFSDLRELVDAIVLPGGGVGAKHLGESKILEEYLLRMNKAGKIVAAICASPATVLSKTGILDGKKATGYPGSEVDFGPKVRYAADRVVVDGNVITSRGPATAAEFAFAIVETLLGRQEMEAVAGKMLF